MDATISVEWGIPFLGISVGFILISVGLAVGELRLWVRHRKLIPTITEDQQPAHPPTAPITIQITKVSDRRRRTAGLAIIPPPQIEALPVSEGEPA